jgi:Asp23 family, cell envelope-related function
MEPLVLAGPEGSITVAAPALTRLVVRAAEGVEGARVRRPRRSVEVSRTGRRGISVSLDLEVAYGATVPGMARAVQERVARAVGDACGIEVERVDVTVAEVA